MINLTDGLLVQKNVSCDSLSPIIDVCTGCLSDVHDKN